MAESESQERDRLNHEALIDAVKAVCATHQGRRVIWHLIEICHPHQTSFSTDPAITAFREGERNIANRIAALIDEADPMIYMQLMQAAQEDKRERIRKRQRAQ